MDKFFVETDDDNTDPSEGVKRDKVSLACQDCQCLFDSLSLSIGSFMPHSQDHLSLSGHRVALSCKSACDQILEKKSPGKQHQSSHSFFFFNRQIVSSLCLYVNVTAFPRLQDQRRNAMLLFLQKIEECFENALSLEPSTHKHAIYPTLCPSCQSNLRNKEVSWYCHCIKVFIILKHLLLHPSNGSHDTSCLSSNGVL